MRVLTEAEPKKKTGENVPQLENIEVVLVYFNISDNQYQEGSRAFCTFVLNKSIAQFLNISPANHIQSETFHSEFSYTEVWFTNQNLFSQDIEDIESV